MPRHSAAVYRRRRAVLSIGMLLAVAMIAGTVWLLVDRPWEDAGSRPKAGVTTPSEEEPAVAPSETAGAEPTPGPTATPAIAACEKKNVEVSAVTDSDSYAAGTSPQLSISLTNTGAVDCTIDVGSTTQVLTVSSGSDVWWRSTDCQQNPSSMIATLAAGTTVTSKEPVIWDRTRSSVETCAEQNRQRAPAGGSSYHVAVSIGGFASTTTKQILLY